MKKLIIFISLLSIITLWWCDQNKETAFNTANNLIEDANVSDSTKSLAQESLLNEQEHNNKINSLWDLFISDSDLKNTTLLNTLIWKLELYKGYNNEYINNMINLYKKMWADLTETTPYSKWERMKKQKELTDYDNYFADSLIKRYNYLIEINSHIVYDESWGFSMDDQNIIDKYNAMVTEENNIQTNLNQKYSDFETYKTEYIKNLSSQ